MSTSSVESQIAVFLGRFTPSVEAQLREARRRLRALFPRGFELVSDDHNALVFAISPTERTSDAFLSVAGYRKWVTLFFLHGTNLNDPRGLLEGQGKQVRSIRLASPADINTHEVEALVAQAVLPHQPALLAAPPLTTIVKLVVAKPLPRRPPSADIDAIYHLVQGEFNYLDQEQVGSRGKRLMPITELPQLARDLYLVSDIVAITCDSGTAAWIHYHHDEPGWIDCAVEAFARIGYPQVGDGIRSCLAVYLLKGGAMTHNDDEVPSNYIIDHEHEIMRSLHAYLLAHDFVFQHRVA